MNDSLFITGPISTAAKPCNDFDQLKGDMDELFPDCMFIVRSVMGAPTFTFVNVSDISQMPNAIAENCQSFAKFIMHGNSIEGLCGQLFRSVKFRKINGKTPEETVKKFLAWFQKNQEIISNLK